MYKKFARHIENDGLGSNIHFMCQRVQIYKTIGAYLIDIWLCDLNLGRRNGIDLWNPPIPFHSNMISYRYRSEYYFEMLSQ